MRWFKNLFTKKEPDLPVVTKNISEPVHAMLKAWTEDKERFTFSFTTDVPNFNDYRSHISVRATITDNKTKEWFEFTGHLSKGYMYTDVMYFVHLTDKNYQYPTFGLEKLCVCDGISIFDYPRWMTADEVEYLKAQMFPYYQKRIARYRDIIKYRKERAENTSRRNSQIAKDKERNRLMEIYK